MNEIDRKLAMREQEGNPIRVAIVGAGQMGTEIITQIGLMRGMEASVVVDLTVQQAMAGFAHSSMQKPITTTDSVSEAQRILEKGGVVATDAIDLATRVPGIDVVVDATGSTEIGAKTALDAIKNHSLIVMMNVECDVTIGPLLRAESEQAGVVYSLAAGDEPAAIVELYRFAHALGFEIVAADKGKNNPLNLYATPDTEKKKADQRRMSARMLCEFVDGSKTAIEMAAVSNATGLVPDVRGMHGARACVESLNKVFVPAVHGGVLKRGGVVDFAIGVHPGVFLVVTTDNQRIREGLVQRDMGEGPYYTLFRPYHLCSIEVPLTIAQCALYHESSGHPLPRLVSECITVAKKDLKKGEVLDGIGEFCYRASIDSYETARDQNLLPLGLAKGCTMAIDIARDTPVTWDMVTKKPGSLLSDLRTKMEAHMGEECLV